MQLLVKLLGEGTITVNVDTESSSIDEIKNQIHIKTHIPQSMQRLIYNRQLMSYKNVSDYNFNEGDTIYLTMKLQGD